jgi:hypothetical protein
MESLELKHQISLLSANVAELLELVNDLRDDPILRAKALTRLADQQNRLENLRKTPKI